MADQDPDDIEQDFSPLYLYLGMACGALSIPGAVENLMLSLERGTINRAYIEYLHNKIGHALEYSK